MLHSLCVFCGSSPGRDPRHAEAARALGHLCARQGRTVVYGGGRVGLMGVLADAALAAGGRVIGVIPQALLDREVGHGGLTELHVVRSMHERKALMADLSEGFVALPGGIGTLDELFEIWTWAQLGLHDKPVGLLDVAGFYGCLVGHLDRVRDEGFLDSTARARLLFGTQAEELLLRLDREHGTRQRR